jgi:hypothetical protein
LQETPGRSRETARVSVEMPDGKIHTLTLPVEDVKEFLNLGDGI